VDAAFAELESHRRESVVPRELFESFVEVMCAKDVGALEQAIRREPRVTERKMRELFTAFLAEQGSFGLPLPVVQQRLGILQACEEKGIDATFRRFIKPASATPATDADREENRIHVTVGMTVNPSAATPASDAAFNELIDKFITGAPADIAAGCLRLVPMLPDVPRRSCILLAMLASHRAGDSAEARKLAIRLDGEARGWDLPGIPSRSLGVAVQEQLDVAPIVDDLRAMLGSVTVTPEEEYSIRSLLKQYTDRQKQQRKQAE
jgi:hypothetical protein